MILGHMKEFYSASSRIADINPYAKTAMNILTYTSKMILDHPGKDDALSRLLAKISEVYAVMTEMQEVAKIVSMLKIYGILARQMLECADFIVHYTAKWKRLDKDIYKETDAAIQSYIEVFDGLIQQLREQRACEIIILHRAAEDLDFSDMVYVAGAGLDISKCCLSGTREDILSKIKSWVYSTGEDVPRVLWLTGAADTGKSAIAHTIAKWSNELGGLGAYFCFDRTRGADRRDEKIFSTIARDLAAHNPFVRRALRRAFHNDNTLKHTTDIARQWREFVVGPVGMVPEAIASPFLIIIDGLNESGEANSRKQILRLLSNKLDATNSQLSELPENFRILVTSRPLTDIRDALHAVAHVQHISMDDIPPLSTERDIQLYISVNLAGPFEDRHFKALAQKSNGVFEWARLACEYIKNTVRVDLDPMVCFERVLAETPENKTYPLDVMYRLFLSELMPEDEHGEVIPMFRSVIGQILALQEPLPISALTAMRLHFPCDDDRYDVVRVIRPLDSLVIGATDCEIPIRLHPSFYDFLTDRSRSHDFFADVSLVQTDLAFALLGIMECGLRFNICALESSYLPNSAVPDLQKRVKESIAAELSYSCRFWGTHVQATSFEPALAKKVEAFFSGERLLFWLEVLALMKGLDGPAGFLSSISDWLKDRVKYTNIINAVRDVQEFIRTFGVTIVHSTPHLYLSALPFSPSESIFRKFAAKFPRTPRVVAGPVSKRLLMENVLRGHARIMSVAISPDGTLIVCGTYDGMIQVWEKKKTTDTLLQGHTGTVWSVTISPDGTRIVSGSNDKTIRMWDVGTRKAVGFPFQGHSDAVRSVAISLDGTCIASGSNDKTIQIWDANNSGALRDPLRGHTDFVLSVAFSPDGNRIVSGSADQTIRLWDMKTGDALCAPLRGHTDWVQSVALSLDGNLLVSGSGDMTIRVWHAITGKALGTTLKGHTDDVLSVAISPDRKHIISGSADNTIRVWDAKTCKAVGDPLRGHTDYVRSVVISSDGQRIVSGSDDTRIWEWNLERFKRQVFEAPATYSSFNLTRTFYSASSHVSRFPTSLTKDGWLVGPEGQLFLLIPHNFYPYIVHDTLVISNDSFQLDLSRITHGTSWRNCREQEAAP